ncbi:MAG: hypothetical protein AMJ53_18575 [Gammaproteobacteria bacterium SG8_11]|nr:MAG: hypothetical protein AMJ53_18575 [Gammaproteobacteria bacterium SG8_11]
MSETFDERQLKEQAIKLAINWINIGYRREQIIRMIKSQGFGEAFSVSATDEAFDRLCERYNFS